jgi:hypothetical protein
MDQRARYLAKRDRFAGIGDQAIRRPGFFQPPGELQAIGHRADTRCRIGAIRRSETPAWALSLRDSEIEPPNDRLTRPAADERADGLTTWHRSHELSTWGSWLCLYASPIKEDYSESNYAHADRFHDALRFRFEVHLFAATLESGPERDSNRTSSRTTDFKSGDRTLTSSYETI